MGGKKKQERMNWRERDETSCRMAVRAETAQLTDGLERSLLILEGATKEEGRKWFCCFAVFCFTLVIELAVYLDHLFPREHSSAIRWIEASTARATRRLTVSTTTPSA